MALSPKKSEVGKVENVPLRVVVADMLRKAIVNGRMKPGTPIIEMALAEQLNVSRAPVREAIQILENDGLIETVAYKGKRVKPLTAKEVEELYSLREQLEAFAIKRVIASGVDVSGLQTHCDAMLAAAAADDFDALTDADEGFHRTLVELADHALLLVQWETLFLRIRQIMALRNAANRDLKQVAFNHVPIIAALENKDLVAALEVIGQHSRSAAEINLNLALFEP